VNPPATTKKDSWETILTWQTKVAKKKKRARANNSPSLFLHPP